MSNSATLLLTNAIVLTMDATLTTQHEPGAVAVRQDGRIRRGRARSGAAHTVSCSPDHRLRRKSAHAWAGQRPHPPPHDPAARPGRRSAPGRVADRLHDAGRTRICDAEFVKLGTQSPAPNASAPASPASPICITSRTMWRRHCRGRAARGVCGQTVLKFPTPDAASFEKSLDAARATSSKPGRVIR